MLINHDLAKTLYILGQSVQSEEIAGLVSRDHPDVQIVHHDNIDNIVSGSQCIIGFFNYKYRLRTINKLKNIMSWPTYIHPMSLVAPTAKIGIGCFVYSMSQVMHNTTIGDFGLIASYVCVPHGTILGTNVVVTQGVMIGGSTTIGDNVFIGQSSTIRDKISICSDTQIAMASVVSKSIDTPGSYVSNRKITVIL